MLSLQAAGAADASVAINPTKMIGAMYSRDFVINVASLAVLAPNCCPARGCSGQAWG
jgi:hypothetical protein